MASVAVKLAILLGATCSNATYTWVNTISSSDNRTICLDLLGGITDNGNSVNVWECNGVENQLWYFDKDYSHIAYGGNEKKCLDAGDMTPGSEFSQLKIWDCNGLAQQRWTYDKGTSIPGQGATVYLQGQKDKCIGTDSSYADGNPATIVNCNQLWHWGTSLNWNIVNGITIRVGVDYKTCLDLPGGKTDNGTPIEFWPCNGGVNQAWLFMGGAWKIQYAADPSKCLDAATTDSGVRLQLWDCNGLSNQKFGYDDQAGTIFLADSTGDATKCVDIAGGNLKNRQGYPQVWSCSGCWNQQFIIAGPAASSLGIKTVQYNHSTGNVAAGLELQDACPNIPDFKPSNPQVAQIILGIVKGFIFTGDPDLQNCVQDFENTATYVKNAVVLLEKGDTKDVLDGLKQIAIALRALPDLINACKAGEATVLKLIAALKAFSSPASFAVIVGKNILVNGVDIITEVQTAIDDWNNQKFQDFGVQVGTALHKLVIGMEKQAAALAAGNSTVLI